MSPPEAERIVELCRTRGNDPTRLLDIVLAVGEQTGHVDHDSIDLIAVTLGVPRVDVEGIVTFYSFLSPEPRGRVVIRLSNDIVDQMKGASEVARGLEEELGIRFGETTPDGRFTLEYTSCIGMSDQAPAALVNDLVVTRLGPSTARRGVEILKGKESIEQLSRILIRDYGDGNNAHDLVRSPVHNNLRRPGPVVFSPMEPGAAIQRALSMSPVEVIREVKTARLRGRGGAGFPTGMKWEFTRASADKERFLICNADEGEPGTFKDRVVLTERPDLLFEGMTVAAYAIGARHGVVYLRAEYKYLRRFLEHVLTERRAKGLLGDNICGRNCFSFDIRIQMGAGAYICGEETALINSMEGKRGEPRTRPPFPAQRGYLDRPTAVNNVETLCCAARILEMGSGWFASIGTSASTGTKLLSVSGDCSRPGVYEVPFGTVLADVFGMCGADEPIAAQVGGPSGWMVGPDDFDRTICFDDLATGGSLVIFGPDRDLLEVTQNFLRFFAHESCGYCTPCRVGTALLGERLDRVLAGRGEASDLDYLEELAKTVKTASRCGLGQTAAHPVLSTLASFRGEYERRLAAKTDGRRPAFDLEAALAEARTLTAGSTPGKTKRGRS